MTDKKYGSAFFDKYYRIIIIPLIILLYLFAHFVINPISWFDYYQNHTREFWWDIIFTMLYCWLITEVSLWIGRQMNEYLPWDKFPAVRAVLQLTVLVVVNYVIFASLLFVLDLYYENYEMDKLTVWQRISISAATSVFISTIHTGYFLLNKWKSSMLETTNLKLQASELKQVLMRAELESLKMQLDPHFMFNNFSVLSELIVENKSKALLFLENISKVYRYMVSNIRKDVISLEEELRFLDSYVYLIKQRLGERFKLEVDVDDDERALGIPPICLQLLVENAIKHNSATKHKPLTMKIQSDRGAIVVENNLQRINLDLPTSKIGLNNIMERYKILSDQLPIVYQDEEIFRITLLLIK